MSLSVMVLLYGCSESYPAIAPLPDHAVVLAFGDSLTAGAGVNKENSYPRVLAGMMGRDVVNAGVPGETSEYGLKRLPLLIDKYQPQLIIIAHGGNDLIRKLDYEKLIQNIRAMVVIAQQRGVDVVLIGIPRPGIFLSSDELYKNIARDYNIPVENTIMADVLSENALKSDGIHPNAQGYQIIAKEIYELLKQTGAI